MGTLVRQRWAAPPVETLPLDRLRTRTPPRRRGTAYWVKLLTPRLGIKLSEDFHSTMFYRSDTKRFRQRIVSQLISDPKRLMPDCGMNSSVLRQLSLTLIFSSWGWTLTTTRQSHHKVSCVVVLELLSQRQREVILKVLRTCKVKVDNSMPTDLVVVSTYLFLLWENSMKIQNNGVKLISKWSQIYIECSTNGGKIYK